MSSDESFWSNVKERVTANLVTWIITGSLSFIVGVLWFLYPSVRTFFTELVTIPLYVIVLVLLAGSGSVLLGFRIKEYFGKSYTDYRKDTFNNVEWTWKYLNGTDQISRKSLKPICPKCNSTMWLKEEKPGAVDVSIPPRNDKCVLLICPDENCEYSDITDSCQVFDGWEYELKSQIASKIDRELRNKGFKK